MDWTCSARRSVPRAKRRGLGGLCGPRTRSNWSRYRSASLDFGRQEGYVGRGSCKCCVWRTGEVSLAHQRDHFQGTNQFYDSVNVLEPRFLQYPWVHVILKMSIIERQTYAIKPQTRKELGIVFHEEVFEELVEEEFLPFFSEDLEHGCSMLVFVAWVACA